MLLRLGARAFLRRAARKKQDHRRKHQRTAAQCQRERLKRQGRDSEQSEKHDAANQGKQGEEQRDPPPGLPGTVRRALFGGKAFRFIKRPHRAVQFFLGGDSDA